MRAEEGGAQYMAEGGVVEGECMLAGSMMEEGGVTGGVVDGEGWSVSQMRTRK